tara:strand:- start:38 stop:223 length:186 start_codon:yes stop_codon:yes gene_type:complete
MEKENTNFVMEKENTNFVGGYVITVDGSTDKIRFNFSKKPNFIHRFFSRILLGWVWEDDNV